MKILSLMLLAGLMALSSCNNTAENKGQTTAAADTAPVAGATTTTRLTTFNFDSHSGVFLLMKAKAGQRDQLIRQLRVMNLALNHGASGPDVFAVHTFPTEPETVYVYSLRNTRNEGATDPIINEIKAKVNNSMASMTVYPLNTLFGRMPSR